MSQTKLSTDLSVVRAACSGGVPEIAKGLKEVEEGLSRCVICFQNLLTFNIFPFILFFPSGVVSSQGTIVKYKGVRFFVYFFPLMNWGGGGAMPKLYRTNKRVLPEH